MCVAAEGKRSEGVGSDSAGVVTAGLEFSFDEGREVGGNTRPGDRGVL